MTAELSGGDLARQDLVAARAVAKKNWRGGGPSRPRTARSPWPG
ncbi:hypothetical protein [Streptomyces lydicus]|nr:hypothetical protein [Streptomyces lydicus]